MQDLSKGTLTRPQVGDVRIKYATLNNGTNLTVIGKLGNNNRIIPYTHKNNHQFYRIISGSHEQAMSTLKKYNHFSIWSMRFLGFLFMWLALAFFIEPVNVIIDFVPILGAFSRVATYYSTLVISFSLTLVTILTYHLPHNFLLLGIVIPSTFGLLIFLLRKR